LLEQADEACRTKLNLQESGENANGTNKIKALINLKKSI